MDAVAKKAQRVRHVTVKGLNRHERKVEANPAAEVSKTTGLMYHDGFYVHHEIEYSSRVLLYHYRMDNREPRHVWEQRSGKEGPLCAIIVTMCVCVCMGMGMSVIKAVVGMVMMVSMVVVIVVVVVVMVIGRHIRHRSRIRAWSDHTLTSRCSFFRPALQGVECRRQYLLS